MAESESAVENERSASIDGESVCFSGYVRLTAHKKDRGKLWAVLRSNKLQFFKSDEEVNSWCGTAHYSVGFSLKLIIYKKKFILHWTSRV